METIEVDLHAIRETLDVTQLITAISETLQPNKYEPLIST